MRRTLARIGTPGGEPVNLGDALAHLRAGAHEAESVWGYLEAAIASIDGAHGWLGRALAPATYELRLDGFPAGGGGCLEMPLPPLLEVTSIAFVDAGGASQTLAPADYVVLGLGGEQPARIVPAPGATWPTTSRDPESVLIVFEAGYEVLPAALRQAILLQVGEFYAFREIARPADWRPSDAVASLLAPYRVW